MAKKVEKGKVGRPKLADTKTKRESLYVCLFVMITVVIIGILGFKILTIDLNPKYLVGTVYNDHINSCVMEKTKIDCGPNVVYMKYAKDGKNFTEINKEDKSIEVKLDNVTNLKVYYKTSNGDLKLMK